jgi:hypothetical protein
MIGIRIPTTVNGVLSDFSPTVAASIAARRSGADMADEENAGPGADSGAYTLSAFSGWRSE